MSRVKAVVQMKDINSHLVCSLCGGYYIDATTIIECLHSFCKTCIVRYLETSNYCPKCDVQVHKTRPLLNIRADYTLQDLVYKLVPGLLTSEIKKRREFYNLRPPSAEGKEDKQTEHERKLLAEEDKISIALEFSPNGKPIYGRQHDKRKKEGEENQKPDNALDCRYLLCPSDFTIGHIKKFIRMKFGLSNDLAIDVFRDLDALGDKYTLMDLIYMFMWRKRSPFRLFYSVYETKDRMRRRKLEQAELTEEPAKKKRAVEGDDTEKDTAASKATVAVAVPKPQPVETMDQAVTKTTTAPVAQMSTAPKTVINKSPLQMKIVTPTEHATSAKTQPAPQQPLTQVKTPTNGKSPVTKLQPQPRPDQAMILPVRLPLSAMKPTPSSPVSLAPVTINKPLVPKNPMTAQHQLPKQVTREISSKSAQKNPTKLVVPKSPLTYRPQPVQQAAGGNILTAQKSPGHKSPGHRSPGHKSPGHSPPEGGHSEPRHDGKITIHKTTMILNSPSKAGKDKNTLPSSSATPHNSSSNSTSPKNLEVAVKVPPSSKESSKSPDQPKAEPKVPPLRIPLSRTDLSKTDISIHHEPIRRPILQHILPRKPKKKDPTKSKADLLQAKFGRNPNGQTVFLNRGGNSNKPSTMGSSGPSHNMMSHRQPTLMPKPAHMNDKPKQLLPPHPNFQNTKNAHNSAPAHNSTGNGSHSSTEQDAPLDLQTPKSVKVS